MKKNGSVFAATLSITVFCALLLSACDDEENSVDLSEVDGMWEVEAEEVENNCPEGDIDTDEEEDDGPDYIKIEVDEDDEELTVYECETEDEDSCLEDGETYDLDGNSITITESETEDLEVPGLDCSLETTLEQKVTFKSESTFSGTATGEMTIKGDDAEACGEVMEEFFDLDEPLISCSMEVKISGEKL
ncbi:MAG: hypothetical protein QNJ97_01200 [Myxococcota bacterium]|nr:hypothetical protein [Myxococcota bacterium]